VRASKRTTKNRQRPHLSIPVRGTKPNDSGGDYAEREEIGVQFVRGPEISETKRGKEKRKKKT